MGRIGLASKSFFNNKWEPTPARLAPARPTRSRSGAHPRRPREHDEPHPGRLHREPSPPAACIKIPHSDAGDSDRGDLLRETRPLAADHTFQVLVDGKAAGHYEVRIAKTDAATE